MVVLSSAARCSSIGSDEEEVEPTEEGGEDNRTETSLPADAT